MPSFRKLSPSEFPIATPRPSSARARIAQAYDALLADFVVGEHGRVELVEDERRDIVRNRLHAAARRRGFALRFRPGRGPLIFCVEAVTTVDAARVAAVAALSERVPTQRGRPVRRQRAERRPAGRYDDMLPRWMRAGQPVGRRGEGKRRQGR
jgi:hypothetical protein